jgi:hypothetical protein
MTPEKLRDYSKKELAEMAKEKGIRGWHAMRKEQLVEVLATKKRPSKSRTRKTRVSASRTNRTAAKKSARSASARSTSRASGEAKPSPAAAARRDQVTTNKVLSRNGPQQLPEAYDKDRIVAMVRDPYWLHVYWEITRGAISRAEAALGQDWHTAKSILRVMDISSDDATAASERHLRDIEIHGAVNNWYIDVNDPPRSFRVDIGYLSRQGKFFVLARSNVVTTPRTGVSNVIDENWTELPDKFRKIYAMSGGLEPASSMELMEFLEERLARQMGSLSVSSFGSGAIGHQRDRKFWFQVDAELIVYGATQPGARVTLQGEPVQLRPDGTFTMRFSLPDSRQIIPAVANSPDGVEERTIVLAVERNTKELEPMIHDGYD